MKAITDEYKAQMKKLVRNRSFVVVTFGNEDITAITEGVWSGSQAAWSELDTLEYEYEYGAPEATLEWGRWFLDGSYVFPYANRGYVSGSVSGTDGSANITLTKTFPTGHTLSGLTLTFDETTGTYPKEVSVTAYDAQNGILANETYYPNSVRLEADIHVSGAYKVMITFSGLMKNQRARLSNLKWGVGQIYSGEQIQNVRTSQDVDPLSRRLPDERLDFTIFDYNHVYDPENLEGLFPYINRGSAMSVQFGYELNDHSVYWLKPDKYSLSSAPEYGNNLVSFSGTGLLGTMTGKFYKAQTGRHNLYDLAEAVLEDANLPPTPSGNSPWDIDVSLKTMNTDGIIPICDHREALQMIAHAARCRLYTDDDNIIHIEPFSVRNIYSGAYSGTNVYPWSNHEPADFEDNYITLEHGRWILDGNYEIGISPYHNVGFIGNSFTMTFDVVHDIRVIRLDFGSDWPTTITAQYYDASNTLVTTTTVGGSQNATLTNEQAIDIKKIVFTLTMPTGLKARVERVRYMSTDFTLDFDSISDGQHAIDKLEPLRNIFVNQYSYSLKQVDNLYSGSTSETTAHIEFQPAQNIVVLVNGTAWNQCDIYAQAVDLYGLVGDSTIYIAGEPLEETSETRSYAVGEKGEDDEEQNVLVTSKEMADALAQHIADYLVLDTTYSDAYRGNPELETGDSIIIETAYSQGIHGYVLTDEIDYNGALHGTVTVKGLKQW